MQEAIENALHLLRMEAIGRSRAAQWTIQTVERYIWTDRAPTEWIRLFTKASPAEILTAGEATRSAAEDTILRAVNRAIGYKRPRRY